MPTIKDRLAKRVRFLRKERQWTQEQLGEKAGLTYKFVGQIERGEASPTVDSLDKLAKAFAITAGELLSFEQRGAGLTKEEIFQKLSKGDLESIKKAMEVLGRVFD